MNDFQSNMYGVYPIKLLVSCLILADDSEYTFYLLNVLQTIHVCRSFEINIINRITLHVEMKQQQKT